MRFVLRRSLLVCLAAGLLAASGPASARQPRPSLHDAAPCAGIAGFTCSELDVPLDWSGRRPGMLHLQVGAGYDAKASRGVLLVLTGGPGQPGVPSLQRFVPRAFAAELRDFRIVVLDQRGTGAGAPLRRAAGRDGDVRPVPAAAGGGAGVRREARP